MGIKYRNEILSKGGSQNPSKLMSSLLSKDEKLTNFKHMINQGI